MNNPGLQPHFQRVVDDVLGIGKANNMQPLMGSEDFSFYQEAVPGYFFLLGMAHESQEKLESVHSQYFWFNEDALPYGAALHAALATRFILERQTQENDFSAQGRHWDEL